MGLSSGQLVKKILELRREILLGNANLKGRHVTYFPMWVDCTGEQKRSEKRRDGGWDPRGITFKVKQHKGVKEGEEETQ